MSVQPAADMYVVIISSGVTSSLHAHAQPLLTREEYERTREVTEQFGRPGGEGQLLQLKLMERARSHDNWVRIMTHVHIIYVL